MLEKGLGPVDLLVQAGNPYEFQPLPIKILEKKKIKQTGRIGVPTLGSLRVG